MKKIYFCVLFLYVFVTQNIFAGQIDKVIISGYGGQHDLDVKTAFLIGYESYNNVPFTGEVILYSYSLQSSFNYAAANDYDLIIRSTSGLSAGLQLAPNYPGVALVMPAGSNNYTHVFYGDVITSPVIITGAGVDSNQTGYGIDFYAIDPITANSYSSYSNGYVAGQLAFISNTLNVNFDSSRTLARVKGTQNGNWDLYNGFGAVESQNIITNLLPVELTSFSVTIIVSDVILNWNTATEVNNFGFEVERKVGSLQSTVGNYEKIGFVNGNGNSNSLKSYSYEDKNISGGKYSYRLKQIDSDGKFEYSKTIEVDINVPFKFELSQNYPNPFNPATTIKFAIVETAQTVVKIYDAIGNEVTEIFNQLAEGGKYYFVNFNASNYASGIYYCAITSGENRAVKKMLLIK